MIITQITKSTKPIYLCHDVLDTFPLGINAFGGLISPKENCDTY